MIEQRKCGRSDITISKLGIGCWSFGGGADDYWGTQDAAQAEAVIRAAIDRGINHFDTAEMYNDGRAEIALGKILTGIRDKAVVASKIPPQFCEPAQIREHLDASLQRLQMDYIDIYYVHWPITKYPVAAAFDTLSALKDEGKIRSIGVSNFGPTQLPNALSTGAQIDLDQMHYNILSRAIEPEIAPICAENNIGIVAYMPLLQGLLTGKWASIEGVPPMRRRTRHFRGDREPARHGEAGAEDQVFTALSELRTIAADLDISMAQLSLAWCMAKPGITCAIAGARNEEQLHSNADAAELALDDATISKIDALSQPVLATLGTNADYWQGGDASRIH